MEHKRQGLPKQRMQTAAAISAAAGEMGSRDRSGSAVIERPRGWDRGLDKTGGGGGGGSGGKGSKGALRNGAGKVGGARSGLGPVDDERDQHKGRRPQVTATDLSTVAWPRRPSSPDACTPREVRTYRTGVDEAEDNPRNRSGRVSLSCLALPCLALPCSGLMVKLFGAGAETIQISEPC